MPRVFKCIRAADCPVQPRSVGNLRQQAACYLKLGQPLQAADTLSASEDLVPRLKLLLCRFWTLDVQTLHDRIGMHSETVEPVVLRSNCMKQPIFSGNIRRMQNDATATPSFISLTRCFCSLDVLGLVILLTKLGICRGWSNRSMLKRLNAAAPFLGTSAFGRDSRVSRLCLAKVRSVNHEDLEG